MSTSSPTPAASRPPRDLTPRAFVEEWLPARYAEYAAIRRVGALEVRVRLVGEGGGEWDVQVGGTALLVRGPAAGETPVTITMSVADWRALACGEEGAFDLLPPRGGPLDLLFVDPALQNLVGHVRGEVRFELPGYHGRTWAALLKLGEQRHPVRPDATVSMDASVYRQILARELLPPEAYFSGLVRVTGDMSLAMHVAMAILARF